MKNIYKITKGQLVVLWVFGVIGFGFAVDAAYYSGFATFLAIFIPAVLIFYTVGWFANSKKQKKITQQDNSVSDKGNYKDKVKQIRPSKVLVKRILIGLGLLMVILAAVFFSLHTQNRKAYEQQVKEGYAAVIDGIEELRESGRVCIEADVEDKFQKDLRDCNLYKGKVKHDYNFCVSLTSINSPASCLYEHDYEEIDCSEETVRNKTRASFTGYDLSPSCKEIIDNVQEANQVIEEYNKLKNK